MECEIVYSEKSTEQSGKLSLQNQELASLRNWLLPMLMNGQVKVSSAEASETKVGKYEEKGEVRVAAEDFTIDKTDL
jgi:hypothetical protein